MATAKKKKSATKASDTKEKEICFVIMPFGGWFDSYYTEIYSHAITNSGLKPKRADDLYRPSNIVQDIWTYTKQAKIILADLSNKNPNVFYELGLAHALAKPAILITQTIEDIPFDLRSLRIIEYDKNVPNWGANLKERITNAIKETLQSPNETIPTAFLETTSTGKTRITKEEKEFLELRQEIDSLKKEVRTRDYPITERTIRAISSVEQEAEDNIKEFIMQGRPKAYIYDMIKKRYGPPNSWIDRTYKKVMTELK